MQWEKYEQLTAAIYEALGKEKGVTIDCYGAQCKVTGTSGAQHQIDVLVKHSNGLQEFRTAIECKHWAKKVDKGVIATLAACVEDAGIDKGVVDSRLGFTKQAIQLAQHMNIELVELREPIEADWEERIKEVHFELNMIAPDVYDFEVLQERGSGGVAREEIFNIPPSCVSIESPSQDVRTLEEVIRKLLEEDTGENREVEIGFPPEPIMKIAGDQRQAKVTGIRFKIRYHHHSSEFTVNAADHVFMIVRDLFGKREFTLDHKGNLTEAVGDG